MIERALLKQKQLLLIIHRYHFIRIYKKKARENRRK